MTNRESSQEAVATEQLSVGQAVQMLNDIAKSALALPNANLYVDHDAPDHSLHSLKTVTLPFGKDERVRVDITNDHRHNQPTELVIIGSSKIVVNSDGTIAFHHYDNKTEDEVVQAGDSLSERRSEQVIATSEAIAKGIARQNRRDRMSKLTGGVLFGRHNKYHWQRNSFF